MSKMSEETRVLKEPGEPAHGDDEGCRMCGAGAGEMCDIDCQKGADEPYEYHDEPVPAQAEGAFGKFMSGIELNESRNVVKHERLDEAAAKRSLARNYQERPLGKIRMGAKR